MRTRHAKIVFTKDLKNLYGKEVTALDGRSLPINLDYYEVEPVQHIGPFTAVRNKHIRASSTSKVIVPNEMIQEVILPVAIDAFKPTLDIYHPNGWLTKHGYLYLYYPHLLITNTIGIEHDIYDLVVRIPINETTGAIVGQPEGKRYSFQSVELRGGYAHSHLLSYTNFDYFCLGASDRGFAKFLNDCDKEAFTEEEFEFFLMQMKSFLEWESIEGTPYHLLADMGVNRNFNGYSPEVYEDQDPDNEIYTAELDEESIPDVVIDVLKYLQTNSTTVTDINGVLVFDPSLDSKNFLEFECSLIPKYEDCLGHHMVNWSEDRQNYVAGVANNGAQLPSIDSFDGELIRLFNIERRIVEGANPAPGETVRTRFSRNFMKEITRLVNEKLLQSAYTYKYHATRISLKEKSNSSANATAVGSNPIFA
jgi:hypothetical protein